MIQEYYGPTGKRGKTYFNRVLSSHPSKLRNNYFVSTGHRSCVFGDFGKFIYVVNGNRSHRYRATIRTTWTVDGKLRENESSVPVDAGGRRSIECSTSGTIPVAHFSYLVVGEKRALSNYASRREHNNSLKF